MGEEIELAAKTTGEVVAALAEASGALGPPQEFWEAMTFGIHYRFYPRVIKQAMAAAKKIERSGLPRRAYSEIPDRLLKAILEGGSLEDDESMQARWANLLANALTKSSVDHRAAFPTILSELEPREAATLDRLASQVRHGAYRMTLGAFEFTQTERGRTELGNLNRLELVESVRTMPTTLDEISEEKAQIKSVRFTDLGWAFVQACRTPQSPG